VEQHVFTGGAKTEKYGEFAAALCADGDGYFTVKSFYVSDIKMHDLD
jgi:hypothetical protein